MEFECKIDGNSITMVLPENIIDSFRTGAVGKGLKLEQFLPLCLVTGFIALFPKAAKKLKGK